MTVELFLGPCNSGVHGRSEKQHVKFKSIEYMQVVGKNVPAVATLEHARAPSYSYSELDQDQSSDPRGIYMPALTPAAALASRELDGLKRAGSARKLFTVAKFASRSPPGRT